MRRLLAWSLRFTASARERAACLVFERGGTSRTEYEESVKLVARLREQAARIREGT